MQTWLDHYISGSGDTLRTGAQVTGLAPMAVSWLGKPLAEAGDLEAARFIVTVSLGHTATTTDPEELAAYFDPGRMEGNRHMLNNHILPFVMTDADRRRMVASDAATAAMTRTVAVKPSADLVRMLSRTPVPAGQEAVVAEGLRSATWYFDLPHHALMVGSLEVRALFTLPVPHLPTIGVLAVLTRPGADRFDGRLVWLYGNPGEPITGVAATDVDLDLLRREVESMIALLVLYRRYIGATLKRDVPHRDAALMVGRKAKQMQKKFSMFHVVELLPPPDRFGRPLRTEERQGWRLGWRSTVTGHFKLQPFGAGHKDRKWIWVDAYERGPADAPRKKPLERLDLMEERKER